MSDDVIRLEVSRVIVIDGKNTFIGVSGAGSWKEGMAMLEEAAEELGAAPSPADKPKRGPKSKAQKEAEAAAKLAAEKQPELPLAMPSAFPVSEPLPILNEPAAQLTEAPLVTFAPPSVGLVPPMAFSPPPPPPMFAPPAPVPQDPAAPMRSQLGGMISALYASVPAEWLPSVRGTVETQYSKFGGNVDAMTMDQLKELIGTVERYQEVCDKAPR
jgi:hypothetical protein